MPSGVYSTSKKKGLFKKGRTAWNKGVKGFMSEEGRESMRKFGTGRYFSKKTRRKMSKSHSREKCHFWKGGITSINAKIRNTVEYKLWRDSVFIRDNFTCQRCGQIGGVLRAHHKNNFATYIDRRLDITNGFTLCNDCHKEFHKRYGIKNNTEEQLEEFLI